MNPPKSSVALLDGKTVAERLNLKKKTFQRFLLRDETFPKPVRFSPRIVRWVETEVDEWIARKGRETT
jgi:predicted DNA-binding transcriptional regulator AlpA